MTEATSRPATMLDVARVAGVSHQTVSRYLRFEGGLKAATSERIAGAIADLDYRPNLIARSMRTRRTGRLAVILPGPNSFSVAPTVSGAVAAAQHAGFTIEALSVGGGAQARAERVRELVASGAVEGVLSLAPLDEDIGALAVPLVVSPDFDDEMRSIGARASGAAVAELVEGLVERGHRRFLHITGDLAFASARARRDVYLDTVARLGVESIGVVEGDWGAESGAAAVRALEPGKVTAIIASNDIAAGGAVHAARVRGWDVPGTLSVTGWDDHDLGALLSPTLTTVHIDHAQLGHNAMSRLVALVQNVEMPRVSTPDDRVVWRESTGPAPV